MARRLDPLVLALTQRRRDLGLSQNRVAVRMGLIPDSGSLVCRWETGVSSPNVAAVRRWADALGCDLTLTAREADGG